MSLPSILLTIFLLLTLMTVVFGAYEWRSTKRLITEKRVDAQSKLLGACGQVIGALGLMMGFGITVYQLSQSQAQSLQLQSKQQVLDFARSLKEAVESLGNENRSTRLHAIHSLSALIEETADHRLKNKALEGAVAVLTSHVKNNATGEQYRISLRNGQDWPPTDVTAALDVLSTLNSKFHLGVPARTPGSNLSNTDNYLPTVRLDLSHVTLINAKLREINLDGFDLRGADLTGSDCLNGSFQQARLAKAKFTNAILSVCRFQGANLEEASLQNATVTGASFSNAIVVGANLLFAPSTLGAGELEYSSGDDTTLLSSEIARPKRWTTRKLQKHNP